MKRATQNKIYRLTHEDLTILNRTAICASDIHLFWSDDWSCEFYQTQARLGFISTALRIVQRTEFIRRLDRAVNQPAADPGTQ